MSATVLAPPQTLWLCPRPLARCPSRFPLVPLLPHRPACKPLPSEVWSRILECLFALYDADMPAAVGRKLDLLLISKDLSAVALPLFYAHVQTPSLSVLERFGVQLHAADRQWDSIRRIPYSAPGRWVQSLDAEALQCATMEETFRFDEVFNQLLPLLPFLTHLTVNPRTPFSRRVLSTFTYRDGVQNMRVLKGLQVLSSLRVDRDHFVELLRTCTRLEELEMVGTGVDVGELPSEDEVPAEPPVDFYPLHLPFLKKLAALSMPMSAALFALLHSPLPALRHLTLTPYDESSVPSSIVPRLIAVHGSKLTSLHLFTVKQWPTTLFPSPPTLLEICPSLRHASLELPLPPLTLSAVEKHQLEILSIPRPKQEFWTVLERLLPKLPKLRFVRARDVKWLRDGMSDKARQAGVQGEMLLWRKRLLRRRIQLLDADWKTGTDVKS